MGAFYPTSTLLRNQTQLQLRIYIADKLYKDWSNLNDIESDTLQTCRDIYNTMNNSTRWQTIGRVQSCSVTKFINRGGDEVAGHEMTMNFLIRDRDGVCGLPMGSYDFDQVTGSLCSPVQIYEDGILIDTVPSGGIYNVVGSPATQVITDSQGNQLYSNSIPSGDTETQVIQDSTAVLKDTSGATISTTSILAEGSEDIIAPNSTYLVEYVNGTDIQSGSIVSGGSVTVTVPNPIVCADTTLEVNGTIEGIVVAGSTVDIQLSNSGGVVTPTSVTQVGNDFQVVLPDTPKDLYWELNFNSTDDIIFIPATVNNAGTLTSGTGSNVGTITVSTDGVTYGALSFPFTPVATTTYYFKRSTATVTGSYTMTGSYV